MSDYTKTTNFTAKDALPTGHASKVTKGAEVDTEFDNIATAVATKANKNTPTATNNVALLGATGDLVDAGYGFPNVNANVTSTDEELNGLDGLTASRVVLTTAGGILTSSTLTSANLENAYYSGGTDVAVADGGTGSSTAAGARSNLGFGSGINEIVGSDLTWATTTNSYAFSSGANYTLPAGVYIGMTKSGAAGAANVQFQGSNGEGWVDYADNGGGDWRLSSTYAVGPIISDGTNVRISGVSGDTAYWRELT